jgi:lipopolysaccharide/colanic/teichoic acid biosynthesis glycosyltransferase
MIEAEPNASPYLYSPEKRRLDFWVSFGALGVSSPVWPLAWGVNRYIYHTPLLYWDRRIGKNEDEFKMPKFETMYPGAEHADCAAVQASLPGPDREDADPRVARFYRVTHFRGVGANEIPQLWSVLVGTMSIIGPRPNRKAELLILERVYPKIYGPWKRLVDQVKPGFSCDPVTQRALGDNDFPEKAEIDIRYIRTATLKDDIRIIRETVNFIGKAAMRPIADRLLGELPSTSPLPAFHEFPADDPEQ